MDQDSRFFNKDKKLIKKMKFPPNINNKVTNRVCSFTFLIYKCFVRRLVSYRYLTSMFCSGVIRKVLLDKLSVY